MAEKQFEYAFKFEIDPTKEQIDRFMQMCLSRNAAWNWTLSLSNDISFHRNRSIRLGNVKKDKNGNVVLNKNGNETEIYIDEDGQKYKLPPDIRLHTILVEHLKFMNNNGNKLLWAIEGCSHVYYGATKNLYEAHKRFLEGKAKPPNFKPRKMAKSFAHIQIPAKTKIHNVIKNNNLINLSQFSKNYGWVKSKESLIRIVKAIELGCEFISYSISTKCGKWYCSISVRKMTPSIKMQMNGIKRKPKDKNLFITKPEIGIDLGQITLATIGDGSLLPVKEYKKMYDQHHISHTEMIIRKRQRKASKIDDYNKEKFGSQHTKNRAKRFLSIGKLKHKEKLQRMDVIHKMTDEITDMSKHIGIEGNNWKDATKNASGTVENPGKNVASKRGRNRNMRKHSYGEIRRQIEYKSIMKDGKVERSSERYASTKTCFQCGEKNSIGHQSKNKNNIYQCQYCGYTCGRDVNGANNCLPTLGLRKHDSTFIKNKID